ncbi:MAG: hypothetical protein M1820_006231 [Bogoriella megaspora]|nr:MAG: hypothetical protein M1820_006231 [Bogoriella megaspora]
MSSAPFLPETSTDKHRYEGLLNRDSLDDDALSDDSIPISQRKAQSRKTSKLRSFLLLNCHLLIASLCAVGLYASGLRITFGGNARRDHILLPNELAQAAPFIRYETRWMQPPGFHRDGSVPTPYEGEPTPEKDALWLNLTQIGVISLSEEENQALAVPSVKAGRTDQPLVYIEVFHQLHCLNYLRKLVYHGPDSSVVGEKKSEQGLHRDHCLDYLRQVIMCHGDVAPISMKYEPAQKSGLDAEWRSPRTCRNWDGIYEFAASRNSSGFVIEVA